MGRLFSPIKSFQVAKDIKLSSQQHEALLRHAIDRLDLSKNIRDKEVHKFEAIDREYYGYLLRDQDDRKRERDNAQGKGLKPVDQKLPLVLTQLDEAVTYFLSVLAPNESIYSAIAPVEHQSVATGFATLLNKHAKMFSHLRHYGMFLTNAMKYNISYLMPEWRRIWGHRIRRSNLGVATVSDRQVVNEGNNLENIDPYNAFRDPSVVPTELYREGEWFGFADPVSDFKLRRMFENGEIFNVDDYLTDSHDTATFEQVYYREKPQVRSDIGIDTGGTSPNFFSILSMSSATPISGFDRVVLYIHINPVSFNLVPKSAKDQNHYQIWRLEIINGARIVRAQHMNNAHGWLPIVCAVPNEDDFGEQTKSFAELLIPTQSFSSYQMNVHQRTARKRLYGTTFLNPRHFPNLAGNEEALAGGIISTSNTGTDDFDIRRHVVQFSDGPDTTQTLRDIEATDNLAQKILPTDILRQVATLERATQHQSASTVMGANRRNLKIAQTIDSQAMEPGRQIQMYNVYQYQQTTRILSPVGELVNINPAEFQDAQLEFAISDGLRGLDRLALIIHIREVLTSVLQNTQVAQQLDVVGIINYWTTLIGDNTDINQFKIKSQVDKLPPELRDVAYQLLVQFQQAQEAGGEGGAPDAALPALSGPGVPQ